MTVRYERDADEERPKEECTRLENSTAFELLDGLRAYKNAFTQRGVPSNACAFYLKENL
jgi:hypothetical protein